MNGCGYCICKDKLAAIYHGSLIGMNISSYGIDSHCLDAAADAAATV